MIWNFTLYSMTHHLRFETYRLHFKSKTKKGICTFHSFQSGRLAHQLCQPYVIFILHFQSNNSSPLKIFPIDAMLKQKIHFWPYSQMKDVKNLKYFLYLTMKTHKCYERLTSMHTIVTHLVFIDQVNCKNTKGLI